VLHSLPPSTSSDGCGAAASRVDMAHFQELAMKMFTLKEYAEQRKISEPTARKQLDRKIVIGSLLRKREQNGFMYYEKPLLPAFNWHDPFNKTIRARSKRNEDTIHQGIRGGGDRQDHYPADQTKLRHRAGGA
jgi:hypothetical protein